jgi:hypothetical protein
MHLLFAQEGQVEENFERLGVGSQDDELGNTAIECLGGCARNSMSDTTQNTI